MAEQGDLLSILKYFKDICPKCNFNVKSYM